MKVLATALEPSANMHLAKVNEALGDAVTFTGIFELEKHNALYSYKDFSVMGIIDVLFKLRFAKKVIKELVIKAADVDKVLLIDAPAFNLPLAKALKKAHPNLEIMYYILPKVWASKPKRIKTVNRYIDKQLSIFEFEKKFYHKAIFVGNPLIDSISRYKEEVNRSNIIAFLPGSRKREIRYLMPVFNALAKEFTNKELHLVIPPFFSEDEITALYGDISAFTISRATHQTLFEAQYAFICSGTATLESALIGTPFTLVYKTQGLEYRLLRSWVKLPFVGLANIIGYFDKIPPMHKELFQEEVTAHNLLQSYQNSNAEEFLHASKALRAKLGSNCSKRVASIILNQ